VCEEVTRFMLNSRSLTAALKHIRHSLDIIFKGLAHKILLLNGRQSLSDVGRHTCVIELKRKNIQDIFFANMQRVKESIRVLEEFSKLKDARRAVEFKRIRYRIYELEKKIAQRL